MNPQAAAAPTPALRLLSFLAVLLMVAYYALALGVVLFLLSLPLLAWRAGESHPLILVGSVAVVAVVAFAVFPRRPRFHPPGPRLLPEAHPALFAILDEVARAAGQSVPAEVYLIHDANAWVSARGRAFGPGGRRMMGIGLPLLQALTVPQIRAVLAHEFGHFDGGDMPLGPWIHRTRDGIVRLLNDLSELPFVQRPLLGYFKLFLRVTHAVSRRQEYAADALAARVAGPEAHIAALRAVHGAAAAFGAYWDQGMEPVLRAGFLPPIAEGFRHFLASRTVAEAVTDHLQEELRTGRRSPYDTHPTLAERIAAIEALAGRRAGGRAAGERRGAGLLSDERGLERELLLRIATDPRHAESLQPIGWDAVGERVHLPAWRAWVAGQASILAGATVGGAASLARDLPALGRRLRIPGGAGLLSRELEARAAELLGAAVAVALAAAGWALATLPGDRVELTKGEARLEPFDAIREIAGGRLAPQAWREACERAGVASVPLGAPCP